MNTCMCEQCKGKKCHYSAYYHREEGFDAMYQNLVEVNRLLREQLERQQKREEARLFSMILHNMRDT